MNKVKELWANNKVLIVLLFILFICFIAIVVVCFTFFLGGNKSPYGERYKDIDKHPLTEEFKNEYVNSLKSDELIDDVKIKTMGGRVIYIKITFVPDITLVEAQSKALNSLSSFSEDLLSYYDLNFTLYSPLSENSEGFTIMGGKNESGSGISWNNNTKVESD